MLIPIGHSLLGTDDDAHTARPELEGAAMDSLRRVVRALRASNAAAEHDHRLTAAQLFVLSQVAACPGQSLRELAQRTLTTQSTVSEVVGRLVDQGMLFKGTAPNDRRRAVLTVSTIGEEVLSRAPGTVQERLVAGFRALPPARQRALAEGLDAWVNAAGLNEVPATMFLED